MVRVFLIRHGETEWSLGDSRYCGVTDLDLIDAGLRQAELLAERLKDEPLAAIYGSDLKRSRQTAEIIASRHPEIVVEQVSGFRELHYGQWEGFTRQEAEAWDPSYWKAWQKDPSRISTPGGESFEQLLERVVTAFEWVTNRHRGQSIAIVGHKATNRALLCHLLDTPVGHYKRIRQEVAAINILDVDKGRVVVVGINDTCHLRPEKEF